METIKLPIYHIGVAKDANNTIKIAILQKTCKEWIVCHCQRVLETEKATIPKKYFTSPVSFSLRSSDVLVKSSCSTLKNKKNILKLALANFGMSSALPRESLVISPKLTKLSQGETATTLWITQKTTIHEELLSLEKAHLFPNTLSCHSADIFYLAECSCLKELSLYFLVYAHKQETLCLFVKNRAVLLSRAFSHSSSQKICDDILATLNYVKEAFPEASPTAVHLSQVSEELASLLAQRLDLPLSPCGIIPSHLQPHWEEYGDALASALHSTSSKAMRFPYDPTHASSGSQKHWLKRTSVVIGKMAALSMLIVSLASTVKLKSIANHTQKLYLLSCPGEPALPRSLHAAEEHLRAIKEASSQAYALQPTIPTSEETLKFLAALGRNCPTLKFSHFTYKLTNFPSEQNPSHPYTAEVLLKGQGSSEEISTFLKKITKHPKLHQVSEIQKNSQTFEVRFNLISQEAS